MPRKKDLRDRVERGLGKLVDKDKLDDGDKLKLLALREASRFLAITSRLGSKDQGAAFLLDEDDHSDGNELEGEGTE